MTRPRKQSRTSNSQTKSLPVPVSKPTINVGDPKAINGESERPSQTVMGLSVQSEYYQGPLPPPDYLRQYDAMYPGAAKKMIDAGIRQTDHRINIEDKAVTAQIKRANLGLWCGFVIGVLGIAGGICIAIFVETAAATIAGSVLSTATLVGLVSVFVHGTRSQRAEREQKSKNNP
jgi:uncharacterized membrane protein